MTHLPLFKDSHHDTSESALLLSKTDSICMFSYCLWEIKLKRQKFIKLFAFKRMGLLQLPKEWISSVTVVSGLCSFSEEYHARSYPSLLACSLLPHSYCFRHHPDFLHSLLSSGFLKNIQNFNTPLSIIFYWTLPPFP